MANSINIYTADATTAASRQFAVNFTLGYLSQDHVKVFVTGELDGGQNQIFRTFTFVNDALIQITDAIAEGDVINVRRDTPFTVLQHDYQSGAVMEESNFDDSFLQTIMLVHEVFDGRGITNVTEDLNFNNKSILNLLDPTTAQGGATKAYVDNSKGTWRGAWATATVFNIGDFFVDSATENMYAVTTNHVAGASVAADIANLFLVIDNSSIAADKATVAADKAIVAADKATVNTDKGLVAADLVLTDADTIATAADAVATAADVVASAASAAQAAANATLQTPARNAVINQEPVSQGQSTRRGFETVDGTATPGLDTTTGDFGYFRWSKDRNNVEGHRLSNSVAGDFYKASDSTAAEVATVPAITTDDVSWSWQTNQKTTGVTSRNKAYTAHYNVETGVSVTGHLGDGIDGHGLPTHLPNPEGRNTLSIFGNRDTVADWIVQSNVFVSGDFLNLNDTGAKANSASVNNLFSDGMVTLDTNISCNASTDNITGYHFVEMPGVSKVGRYIGTGAVGNYVDCKFGTKKAVWVLVKNLSTAQSWVVFDGVRAGTQALAPDTTAVDATVTGIEFVPGGFVLLDTAGTRNTLNDEYLFLAFAETSTDATKAWTDYSFATTQDTLSIDQGSILSFAGGFDGASPSKGQVDTLETVGAGVTHVLGATHENKHYWLFKDLAGAYGVSEFRPLTGITRNDADKWGEVSPSDVTLRTTVKHFDSESAAGVTLASDDNAGASQAWKALSKGVDAWAAASTTTSWWQYKQTEARILKSWRISTDSVVARDPKRFTIEGSNDGFTWVAIDSTYTASDYSGNGVSLWGDLQLTAGNTTSYLYHRINITANNGDPTFTQVREIEFNTILPSDYYLVTDGKMYNSAGSAINRVYLAELRTNDDGEVSWFKNLPIAQIQGEDAEFQGDLTVHNTIINQGVTVAAVVVDCTQNPPLILTSFGVADVVDLGTGKVKVMWDEGIDGRIGIPTICSSASEATRIQGITEEYLQVYTYNAPDALTDNAFVSISLVRGAN